MNQVWKIEKSRIDQDGMPYYLIRPATDHTAPLVIMMHGLGSSKDTLLPAALDVAQHGYAVALPDAQFHGERRPRDFDARISNSFMGFFLECVTRTADEIEHLITELQARPDIATGEAAMMGFSLGGYITYRSAAIDKRLSVIAPCGASGSWAYVPSSSAEEVNDTGLREAIASVDPARRPGDFPPRAILIQHGTLDETVPIEHSKRFYELLRPYYRYSPDKLKWVDYPDLGHEMPPQMLEQVIEWVQEWLPAPH